MLQKIKSLSCALLSKHREMSENQARSIIAFLLACTTILCAVFFTAHKVNVFDGENNYSVVSLSRDPMVAMKKVSLPSDYKIENISSDFFSTNIEISYPFTLTVTLGNDTVSYSVTENKLGVILNNIGIELDEYDTVSLSLDTVITKDTSIVIEDVEFVNETYQEKIPFKTTAEYSDKYEKSTKTVVSQGKTGVKNVTYSVKYVNGKAVSSEVISETIVENAVNQKTIIGTKVPKMSSSEKPASSVKSVSTLAAPKDLKLDSKGVPVNYSSKKVLKATAYAHTGNKCSTGVSPQPGYIAVDPKEIPYGTEMYIVSADGKYVYGYAIAADTGGFTRGSVDLDLFFNTKGECVNFGVRNVNVYFLD